MDEIRMAVEIREDEGRLGPGRIFGVVMKYNTRASDRPELFEDGALKWPEDIVLNRQHSRKSPIMRVKPIVVGDEVRHEISGFPDTQSGRDAAVEIRQGLFKGLSVEFKSLKESVGGGIRRISSAMLRGIALVDSPSYSAAAVEVRAKGGGNRPNEGTLWL